MSCDTYKIYLTYTKLLILYVFTYFALKIFMEGQKYIRGIQVQTVTDS